MNASFKITIFEWDIEISKNFDVQSIDQAIKELEKMTAKAVKALKAVNAKNETAE